MSLPTKLGIGTLALGSAFGAGYVGVFYLSKEDKKEEPSNTVQQVTAISEIIEKDYEYILLDTKEGTDNSDKAHWDTNWNNYKTDSLKLEKDIFGLDNWTKTNTPDLTEALKKKCKVLTTTKISNKRDALYSQVTSYCARGVTIADETKGLRIVNTKEGDNTDESIWTNRNRDSNALQNELGKLGIQMQGIEASKIKKGCRDITTKSKKDDGYKDVLEAYKRVCVKKAEEN